MSRLLQSKSNYKVLLKKELPPTFFFICREQRVCNKCYLKFLLQSVGCKHNKNSQSTKLYSCKYIRQILLTLRSENIDTHLTLVLEVEDHQFWAYICIFMCPQGLLLYIVLLVGMATERCEMHLKQTYLGSFILILFPAWLPLRKEP